jgi:hypothetical protein
MAMMASFSISSRHCLDEELLGERVADLDGGALLVTGLVELGGREEAGAVDAVAARLRADVDHRVADAGGARAEDPVGADQTDGEGVHEDVLVVRGIEVDLAADGRHADAIAVATDAAHDATDQVAGAGVVEAAEAQRVEVADRARAHREHVAQDAADAGGGALVRLDVRGMVVALDLEHHREPVADRHRAGVLAGPCRTRGPVVGRPRNTARELL